MRPDYTQEQMTELGSWALWHQLVKYRTLEELSAKVPISEEELEGSWSQFCTSHTLDQKSPEKSPPELLATPPAKLKEVVACRVRITKWKEQTFGPQAQDHFTRRKPDLDRVVYSLLRAESLGVARELWFRLSEKESTFEELAPQYSVGDAAYTAGLIGPVSLGSLHPSLSSILRSAAPGYLLPPKPVAEWYVVARLEHHIPAKFDATMREKMIDELASRWIDQKINGQESC